MLQICINYNHNFSFWTRKLLETFVASIFLWGIQLAKQQKMRCGFACANILINETPCISGLAMSNKCLPLLPFKEMLK